MYGIVCYSVTTATLILMATTKMHCYSNCVSASSVYEWWNWCFFLSPNAPLLHKKNLCRIINQWSWPFIQTIRFHVALTIFARTLTRQEFVCQFLGRQSHAKKKIFAKSMTNWIKHRIKMKFEFDNFIEI